MKKKEKLEKVVKLFREIDYSRLIQDLYTVDGFTEATIINAIKAQIKGASIHQNGAFYREVVEPFTSKLKEAGLMTIKKIGPTRYYTISDRKRAIELFKEKKSERTSLPVLPAIPMPKQQEEQQLQQQEHEKKVEVEEVVAESPTPSISEKIKLRGKNDLLGLIAIMGCMYREKTQKVSSSVPKKVLVGYGINNPKLHRPIADFNTLVGKQELLPYIIKKYGERRALKYQIDVSPRKVLKFLRSIGDENFPEDEEIARFLDWGLGKIDDVGKKPAEIKVVAEEEEPTKVKVEVPEAKRPKTVDKDKLWVITKMSLSEFKERYNVEAVELMTTNNQTLLEAEVEDKKTIDIIKSELRQGEKCHGQ